MLAKKVTRFGTPLPVLRLARRTVSVLQWRIIREECDSEHSLFVPAITRSGGLNIHAGTGDVSSRIHRSDEARFFPPFAGSLSPVLLSAPLNAPLIVFGFSHIISFRLPLLILKPPSLSGALGGAACLPPRALSLPLSFSLAPSKCTHYWCFSLHRGPCDAFLFWALPFVSRLLFVRGFSVVFSPPVYSHSCAQMYGYARGLAELLKSWANTDF